MRKDSLSREICISMLNNIAEGKDDYEPEEMKYLQDVLLEKINELDVSDEEKDSLIEDVYVVTE